MCCSTLLHPSLWWWWWRVHACTWCKVCALCGGGGGMHAHGARCVRCTAVQESLDYIYLVDARKAKVTKAYRSFDEVRQREARRCIAFGPRSGASIVSGAWSGASIGLIKGLGTALRPEGAQPACCLGLVWVAAWPLPCTHTHKHMSTHSHFHPAPSPLYRCLTSRSVRTDCSSLPPCSTAWL